MAAEGDNIIRFNYTDEDRRVPRDATHVTIDASVTIISTGAFYFHRNIVEVIFDRNVKKVERLAFAECPSLRRLIMPGVEIVEMNAFDGCEALTDVECGNLEIIEDSAFSRCESWRSINLLSAKIVKRCAFHTCETLADAKFGGKLESIEGSAFIDCRSLERITIPLKDGMITHDNTFTGCDNLKQVDLVEGEVHATIAALQLEEWRNDMYGEINSINRILPTTPAGSISRWGEHDDDEGGNARAIRTWIRSVIGKVIHYKAEHQRLLDEEVKTAFEQSLPRDIVMNNVLPFLELPSYTFEVGDHKEGEEQDYLDSEEEDDEDY